VNQSIINLASNIINGLRMIKEAFYPMDLFTDAYQPAKPEPSNYEQPIAIYPELKEQ
jgi:hypothetical protein